MPCPMKGTGMLKIELTLLTVAEHEEYTHPCGEIFCDAHLVECPIGKAACYGSHIVFDPTSDNNNLADQVMANVQHGIPYQRLKTELRISRWIFGRPLRTLIIMFIGVGVLAKRKLRALVPLW